MYFVIILVRFETSEIIGDIREHEMMTLLCLEMGHLRTAEYKV
jgi:hypothetical protein